MRGSPGQVGGLCLNGGCVTVTGSERRAVLRDKKISSVLDVVLELPERHLVMMCPAGARNKSLSSGKKSGCRQTWQLLVRGKGEAMGTL